MGDRFLNDLKLRKKIGTYRRYKSALKKMASFNKSRNLPMDKITVLFLKKFQQYAVEKRNNRVNTIHSNLRIFRRIINVAIEEELFPLEKSPFLRMKLKREKVKKVFLTEEELKRIEDLELVKDSWMELARNTFVFSSYAGGLRISDVIVLRWQHFNGTHISITTRKTKTLVSIKLPKVAIDILNFYHKKSATSSDFIFPFLKKKKDYTDAKIIFNAISTSNTIVNRQLCKLAKLAKIDKHISFHISRHTWATRAIFKGMRMEYVSKLMGHASIETTQIYAKIVNKELDKAMDVFDE